MSCGEQYAEKVITRNKTQNDVNSTKLALPRARNGNSRKGHGKIGFRRKSSKLLKGRSSQNSRSIKNTAGKSGTPIKRTIDCDVSIRDKSCGILPVAGKNNYKLEGEKHNVDTNSNRDEKFIHKERSPLGKSKTNKAVGCNLVSDDNLVTVPKLQTRENSFHGRSEDVENNKFLQIDYSEELSHPEHSQTTHCDTQNPAEGSADSEGNIAHCGERKCNPLLLLDASGNCGMLETFLNDVHKLQSNPRGEKEILLSENNETFSRKQGSNRTKIQDRRDSNVTPNTYTS